jgi:Phosphopantetheine attachment site
VGGLTYNTDLYRAESAQLLHQNFVSILSAIVANPQTPLSGLLANLVVTGSAIQAAGLDSAGGPESTPSAGGIQQTMGLGSAPLKEMPSTDAEKTLAQIWQSLLKLQGIERQDNFFDLGGNSLLAMNAVALAEKHFNTKVDARRYVFESLAQLAQAYVAPSSPLPPSKPGLLGRLFGGRRGA